jgi:cyclic pyranopterin phosphate synthase
MTESNDCFTHLDPDQRPRMVDVSGKTPTVRTARARSVVRVPDTVAQPLADGTANPKGPVFHTAILAGILASKKTSELIPLCHPIPLEDCHIEIELGPHNQVIIDATCRTTHKTGVEMEALTAATVAALTIYDMCKAFSHDIEIVQTCLLEKTGGKSDRHLDPS